jgi:hypothetical protein
VTPVSKGEKTAKIRPFFNSAVKQLRCQREWPPSVSFREAGFFLSKKTQPGGHRSKIRAEG